MKEGVHLLHDRHVIWHFLLIGESLAITLMLSNYFDLVPLLMKVYVEIATVSGICVFVYSVISTWMIMMEYRDYQAEIAQPYLIEKKPELLPFPIVAEERKVEEPKKPTKKSKLELISEHQE